MSLRTGFDWIEIPVTTNDRATESYGLLFETKMKDIYKSPGFHSEFLPNPDGGTFDPLALLMQEASSGLVGLVAIGRIFKHSPKGSYSWRPRRKPLAQ